MQMRSVLKPVLGALGALLVCVGNAWGGFTADPTYQDTIGPYINVGRASLFTVLSYGDLNQYDNTVSGASLIRGNVGIGGNGNFSVSAGDLYGDLYIHTGGTATFSGPANHHGYHTFYNADTPINNALQDAWSLSAKAASELSTTNYTVTGSFNGTTENGSKNVKLFSTGRVVLNLQDFVMTEACSRYRGPLQRRISST